MSSCINDKPIVAFNSITPVCQLCVTLIRVHFPQVLAQRCGGYPEAILLPATRHARYGRASLKNLWGTSSWAEHIPSSHQGTMRAFESIRWYIITKCQLCITLNNVRRFMVTRTVVEVLMAGVAVKALVVQWFWRCWLMMCWWWWCCW